MPAASSFHRSSRAPLSTRSPSSPLGTTNQLPISRDGQLVCGPEWRRGRACTERSTRAPVERARRRHRLRRRSSASLRFKRFGSVMTERREINLVTAGGSEKLPIILLRSWRQWHVGQAGLSEIPTAGNTGISSCRNFAKTRLSYVPLSPTA